MNIDSNNYNVLNYALAGSEVPSETTSGRVVVRRL